VRVRRLRAARVNPFPIADLPRSEGMATAIPEISRRWPARRPDRAGDGGDHDPGLGVQVSMRQAIEAMQEIGRTVTDVNTLATGVAVAIEEREAATGEIRRGVAQAADGTSTVTDNMADVSTAPGARAALRGDRPHPRLGSRRLTDGHEKTGPAEPDRLKTSDPPAASRGAPHPTRRRPARWPKPPSRRPWPCSDRCAPRCGPTSRDGRAGSTAWRDAPYRGGRP
jgi:hypothetical protein